jgi:hypothetical protein
MKNRETSYGLGSLDFTGFIKNEFNGFPEK